ncbi:MAG: membrane protein insertase YidC [Pseudomonadota bacterium]|nr:membrane protein insertase YidC [Pseudomonadota bacterium]
MTPQTDYTRLFLAVFLAAIVLFSWQALVEWPRRQHLAQMTVAQAKQRAVAEAKHAEEIPAKSAEAEENPDLTRQRRLALSPRITVNSSTLHGSIALKGARFDDLVLARYKETIDPNSPDVTLFSPNGDKEAFFAQVGWLAQGGTKVPDQRTLWQADKTSLAPGETVHLRWDNGEGVTFLLSVSLDRNYMFDIASRVENHSGHAISLLPYGYVNRAWEEPAQRNLVVHEGPLGVMTGTLDEVTYKDLREKGNKVYDDASGWFGITDKYWLAALVPAAGHNKVTFSHYAANGQQRYQTDYLGSAVSVADRGSSESTIRLFAGAKEINLLDHYAKGYDTEPPIPLFDRAIDFGMLYFLTRPMLLTLNFFHALIGNFGIAIMLLTIVVRLLLYPLANKSYHAAASMRALQPEMTKLRERYFDDQITLNKEMLSLYKREKVNPASGCLPVLLQMPVFFALYRVLYVSIEMRHAPFFGWIRDLSVADPSNLFTLFGLIPWEPPGVMHLGLLPIAMCATMIIQMRQQPKPADPTQARMMTWMPYFMLFLFARMPAGLVLYWTWSNLISILQQRVITIQHERKKAKKARKARNAAA